MLTGVADEILAAGSPDLLLKAGRTILDFARVARQPTSDLDQVDYDGVVVPLVEKSKQLLFAAAASGRPEAYEWIGTISQQFAGKLGDDTLSQAVRGRTRPQWSTTAAVAGAWDTVCRIAESSLTRIRSERGWNAEQYNSAMEEARECLDRAPPRKVLVFENLVLESAGRPCPRADVDHRRSGRQGRGNLRSSRRVRRRGCAQQSGGAQVSR
jgi:hypothetical protein